jgi:hypothetical protein
MELFLALGLGIATGTNAYLPLLLVGALARWTPLLPLPDQWTWLSADWTLIILAVLVVGEFVAARVPGFATVNDLVQSVVRPTSAGIAVSSAAAGGAGVVTDWDQWWASGGWIPVVVAVAVSLTVHLVKLVLRAGADALTGGLATPVVAAVDDTVSVGFSVAALLAPLLIPVLIVVGVGVIWWLFRRRRARKAPEKH